MACQKSAACSNQVLSQQLFSAWFSELILCLSHIPKQHLSAVCHVQDPAVLELFYPYLPKDRRTYAGFQKAMAIETWRLQVLTGESQVIHYSLWTPLMLHVNTLAPPK